MRATRKVAFILPNENKKQRQSEQCAWYAKY